MWVSKALARDSRNFFRLGSAASLAASLSLVAYAFTVGPNTLSRLYGMARH